MKRIKANINSNQQQTNAKGCILTDLYKQEIAIGGELIACTTLLLHHVVLFAQTDHSHVLIYTKILSIT